MSGPLAVAFVDVHARTDQAESDLRRGLDAAFDKVTADAAQTGEAVEGAFAEAGSKVDAVFAELRGAVDKALDEVRRTAPVTADRVQAAFDEAATKIGEDFHLIGEDAQREGEKVEGAFHEASSASSRALSSIDDKGALHRATSGIKGLIAAAGGAYALIRVGQFLRDASKAGAESAAIGRVTDQVIKSTGGSAKLTAAQIGDLSNSLAAKTGIDDELIQSGANVLLTFRNVRDEAGKGNDIFTRATKSASDLSTVLGGDLKGANVLLGKALNDPVKGIAALGRAGVTFTAQQKEQIKYLVASGDALGAQKLILKEVEGQVGGAAEAAADPMKRLGVVADNLKESLGAGLNGAIGPLSDGLIGIADKLAPTIASVGKALGSAFASLGPALGEVGAALGPALGPLGDTIGRLVTALAGPLTAAVTALAPVVRLLGPPLAYVAQVLGGALTVAIRALSPIIAELAGALGPIIVELANGFQSVVRALAPILGILGNALAQVARVLGGSLRAVIVAIVPPLVSVVEVLAKSLAPILPILAKTLASVAGVIGQALVVAIKAVAPLIVRLAPLFGRLVATLGGALGRIIEKLAGTFARIVTAAQPLLPLVAKLVGQIGGALLKVFAQLVPAIEPLTESLLPPMADLFGIVAKVLVQLAPIIGRIAGILGNVLGKVFQALAPALPALSKAFGQIADALGQVLLAIVPLLPPLLNLVALILEKVGAPLLVDIATAFAKIATAIAPIAVFVAEVLAAGLAKLVSLILTIGGAIGRLDLSKLGGAFRAAAGAVAHAIGGIITTVAELPGRAVHALASLGGKLAGAIGRGMAAAGRAIATGVTDLIKGIGKLPGRLLELQDKLVDAGLNLGKGIIRGLGRGISATIRGALSFGKALADGVKKVLNGIIDRLNDAFDFTLKGPGPLPDLHVNLKDLPKFARGGVTSRPSVFGEAGTEVAIPLDGPYASPARARRLAADSGLLDLLARADGGAPVPSAPAAAAPSTDARIYVDKLVVPPQDGDPVRGALSVLTAIQRRRWLAGTPGARL